MKSITCKASDGIITIVQHVRDINDAAVVMQINFTLLKSEINGSQKNNASQCLKKELVI